MKRLFLLFFAAGIMASATASTDELVKMPKITPADTDMKIYDKDSTAGAVVLRDIGMVDFSYKTGKGRFEYTFTRKTRIKILNANQFEQANQVLLLYLGDDDQESLVKLKGSTYNSEGGKLVESEMKKESIFKEAFDKRHTRVKFTLPNVKVGSIIEYEYSISSPFLYVLPNWEFQWDIPVIRSTYSVKTPEFYNYGITQKGYLFIPPAYSDYENATASITHREMIAGGGTTSYTGSMEFIMNVKVWDMLNVPALTEEPYISCLDNYISQINLELTRIKYPKQEEQLFSETWESVLRKMRENENLGKQLSVPSAFLNKHFDEISAKATTNAQKMKMAYEAIQQSMVWNKQNSMVSLEGIKNAYQKGNANAADINLLLVRLLKDLSIDAYPVVLSTREHGFLPAYPNVEGFNYVIAMAKVDGKNILLDATQKSLWPGVLPKRCLNGKGLVLKETGTEWVDLTSTQTYNKITSIDAKLSADGQIDGKLSYVKKGYAAITLRNNTFDANDREDYYKELQKNNAGLTLLNKEIRNIDSLHLPTREVYDFKLQDKIDANGDLIYLSPVIIDKLSSNPFRLKERQYPVDYTYPFDETYIVNLTLPENYKVEEQPKPESFVLPSEHAKFSYIFNVLNSNSIQLTYKLNIKNTLFSQEEYPALKEFYTQILKKLNEQVVLKKI